MANTCMTIYICEGTRKQIEDLNKVLTELIHNPVPYVKNGWGNTWLGCIINRLGGNYEEWECRGEVIGFNVDKDNPNALCMLQDTAWREQKGFRHFLEQHYPGMKIYWQDEESGCDWYATNDEEGRYFGEKYALECSELYDENVYYTDLSSAIKAVEEIIKHPLNLSPDTDPDTATDIIRKALLDYIDDLEDKDAYAWFSYFSIIKD